MKYFIGIFLLCFVYGANAQNIKLFTPSTTVWDISDKAREDFELCGKLAEEISEGKRTYESLNPKEKRAFDNYSEQEDFLLTGNIGCSWYCGAEADTIYCSSQLANYKDINYGATNIHDFDAKTAWIEGVKGYGIGEKISISFPAKNPPITMVQVFNGYMKSEKAWRENSRVRTLKMYVDNNPYALLQLQDIIGQQNFAIDTLTPNGIRPLVITFEIYDVYKGTKYAETAVSEINFDGTGVHCFVAGTTVTMANGNKKLIEDIAEGDEVLTYNITNKSTSTGVVSGTANARHHNMVQIETEKGTITATNDHPFYVVGKGWCAANPQAALQYAAINSIQLLQTGDELLLLTSNGISLNKILSVSPLNICVPAYTITSIEGGNSFFANDVLVLTEETK